MEIENRRWTDRAQTPRPTYVVWELTLRCDLACRHCGSRAGPNRRSELTLDEARGIARQLAEMGTREVAFIGGEAYLWPHWLELVREVAALGMRPTMTSGGRMLAAKAKDAAKAGLEAVSVSVDGLRETHDTLRAVKGSFDAALATLRALGDAGITPLANTQWNRLNLPEVEPLGRTLLDAGIRGWQVQLTGPMGRAADQPDWLLQPYDLLELFPRLAAMAREAAARGVRMEASNNLGYYGPYEELFRRGPWAGCAAGVHVLGIEADGSVKGCPSLPSRPYVGGNLRETPLAQIWAGLDFARSDRTAELWGFCAGCYYAEVCQGGCSWTAHTLLGRRGNMPYCHHRALELQAAGRRERLVQVARAPGEPFDFGRFELIEEPIPSGDGVS